MGTDTNNFGHFCTTVNYKNYPLMIEIVTTDGSLALIL